MLRNSDNDSHIVVFIDGRLDVNLAASVESDLHELIQKHPAKPMIVNLAGVEYMSSSGLRVLVAVMRELKKTDQKMILCEMNTAIHKLFEVVELSEIFEIYQHQAEAEQSISA